MSWTEVLKISASQVPFGVSSEGSWGYLSREGQWTGLDSQLIPTLVTVLEGDPETVKAALQAGLNAKGLAPDLAGAFPLGPAIRMGLTWPSGSGYWQAHALRWVEQLGGAAEVESELTFLIRQGASQAIRHRARRLVRTLST
jgi:hypothetical protein